MNAPEEEDPTAAQSTTETIATVPPSLDDAPQTRTATAPPSTETPANPALEEPDALAIIQKGQDASMARTTTSVTQDRKEELLVKARGERRRWVQQVPLPYASARDPSNVWSSQDRLYPLQSSAVCQKMPVVTRVLSELYGLENQLRTPDQVAERVDQLIQPFLKANSTSRNGIEMDEEQLMEEVMKQEDPAIQAYHQFWSTLLKPECALLIQGMRNFLGNLSEAVAMERMAVALKSYVDSTVSSTLPTHPAWRDQDLQQVKRSLESFLYGHARPLLDQLEWTGLFALQEKEWTDKLTKLQFVEPQHLEIQCLVGETSGPTTEERLQDSVRAMLSIDQYFSPYEKLQRILLVYQGVNTALSAALNDASISTASGERKLPSADDVLPTIILTVLKAKPVRLLRNLQLIEVFAPQEYLRGEAGYAYTNLYGAVQFLQDLNLDKPDSLSISADDFKKGLEANVKKTQERFQIGKQKLESTDEGDNDVLSTDINVLDVREARLKGETIDLEWAVKHQLEHPEKYGLDGQKKKDSDRFTLPDGFNRSYSFLNASPQDIRLSDLPKLLTEYKMMVQVTEKLIGERGARLATEKKRRDAQKSRRLDDSFYGIVTSGTDDSFV